MGDTNNSPQSIGKVLSLHGNAVAESASGSRTLEVGADLYQDDILITLSDSKVEIQFNDDTLLSQGENSKIKLDSYIFDPEDGSNSGLLLDMVEGTFRCVTGKIVEQNPDNFILKSPLATLGIRGTTTVSEIRDNYEKHGAEDISHGKSMVLKDAFGTIRFISSPKSIIDFSPDTPIGMPRSFSKFEQTYFKKVAPISTIDEEKDFKEKRDSRDDDSEENEDTERNIDNPTEELEDSGDVTEPVPITFESPIWKFTPDYKYDPSLEMFIHEGPEIKPLDGNTIPEEPPPPENAIPEAVDYKISLTEGKTYIGVIEGIDLDDDTLNFELVNKPEYGEITSFTRIGDKSYQYTYVSKIGDHVTDSFTYKVSDQYNSDIGTVIFTIGQISDQSHSIKVTEDTVYKGTLSSSENEDVSADSVSYALELNPLNGKVELFADGTYTYTPNENFFGTDGDRFLYKSTDSNGNTVIGTVMISVIPKNDDPEATETDTISVTEDTIYTGTLKATDIDGDPLTYTLKTEPSHGKVVIQNDGTYTYTPETDYNGTDNFSFTVSDGNGGSDDEGKVQISISSVNDTPIAGNATIKTDKNEPLADSLPGSDVDGDTLTYEGTDLPKYGSVFIYNNGLYTYTPNSNFQGTDTFSYTVTDSSGQKDTGTVTVAVGSANASPTALDSTITINEDSEKSGQLVANDSDGDAITYAIATNPSHGTVTVTEAGSFKYTPTENYSGSDSFTWQATDTFGGTDTGTVTITVSNVNDNPVAADSTIEATAGKAYEGTLSATDIDSDSLTFSTQTSPDNGTLSIDSSGSFTYTPSEGFNGTDDFTFQVSDGSGGTDQGTVTVTITQSESESPPVTEENQAPVTSGFDTLTGANTELNATLTATDADEDTLIFSKTSDPSHGTATVNEDGSFTYNPTGNFWGEDAFNYSVSDTAENTATGTVSLDIGSTDNADSINGNASNDTIDAQGGNDSVSGGAGNDSITGGTGTDSLTGGAGDDTFTYTETNELGDAITDFNGDFTIADKIHFDIDQNGFFSEIFQNNTKINLMTSIVAVSKAITSPVTAQTLYTAENVTDLKTYLSSISMSMTGAALGFGLVGTNTGTKKLVAVLAKNTNTDPTVESVTTYTIATLENIKDVGTAESHIDATDIVLF